MDGWAGRQVNIQINRWKLTIKTFHCYGYSNGNLFKGYAGVKYDPV